MKKHSSRRWQFALATLVTILFLAADGNAKDTWVRVQSKNFILISNASPNDARKAILKLEQFRSAFSIIFPRTKLDTPLPTTVLLFKTDADFNPFKPRVKGKIEENVGGYFLARPHMNYIVLAADIPTLSPYEIIFHEYEHYVLHNNVNRLPVWLDEGLAEFFSSFDTSDKDQKATLGSPIARHVLYLRDQPLVSLDTLLKVDRKSPYYHEGRKAGTFYAESWALVHYLMLADEGKHRPQLQEFINSLSEDRPVEELFTRAFQVDLKALEERLRSYVNRHLFPVLNATFSGRISGEQQLTTETLTEAQSQYYLGDLYLQIGRPQDAEKRLEKSLELDPAMSSSESALGIVRATEEKPDEARKLFQSAISHDPDNYLAHYYLGLLLLHDGLYDEAIKSYREAVRLRPQLAFTYTGLGYAYRKAHRTAEAAKTFEEGRRINPREEYFYRAIAYIYLEQRRGDAAAQYAVAYLNLRGWQDEHSPYLALVRYFGLRQETRDADARKNLDEAASQLNESEWPYPVIRYLKHTLSLAALLSSAGTDQDKLTEAHAYAGLELSLNGERQTALEHLRWVREKGNQDFVEYPLALAELGRLEDAAAAP